MSEYSFKDYAPSLSDSLSADKIYEDILSLNPQDNIVTIDMANMVAMAITCACVIFGRLYVKLGADVFTKNIKFKNITEPIIIAVKWGIKHAIESEQIN